MWVRDFINPARCVVAFFNTLPKGEGAHLQRAGAVGSEHTSFFKRGSVLAVSRFVLVFAFCLAGCRGCLDGTTNTVVEPVRFDVAPVVFADTWLGTERVHALALTNPNRVSSTLPVSVTGPFSVTGESIAVGGGSTVALDLTFRPTIAGEATGTLTLGEVTIDLRGTGLEVPQCVADDPCEANTFDLDRAQCVAVTRADGVSCDQQCVASGQCLAGACVGQPKDCGDADACTVDACGSAGCTHEERTCPAPTSPCKIALCDSATGCAEQDANDGTICGADSCLDAQVSVCVSGQCVSRARPDTERCTNTWVPRFIPSIYGARLAYDALRRQTIAFVSRQTWVWDGTMWTQRFPAAAPPDGARTMVSDTRRNRVVLFVAGQTWEWDGSTWLQMPTAGQAPSERSAPSMAYDARRRRVVLFGGSLAGQHTNDTWEWDGLRWQQLMPAIAPSERAGAAMAWDPVREKIVLFGGATTTFDELGDTWEWDGTAWTQRSFPESPQARYSASLTWDTKRRVLTLFGGTNYDPLSDLWEFDGLAWVRRPTAASLAMSGHGASWDSIRERLVVLDRGLTWEWDGQTWASRRHVGPSQRIMTAAVFDPVRGHTLLFGGYSNNAAYESFNDLWAWDEVRWTQLATPIAPPKRYASALVWDSVRQRAVLFGGSSRINTQGGGIGQDFGDTWEWDGAGWTQRMPATSPTPSVANASAYDPARQRMVVAANGTWEFDGTTWTRPVLSSPAASDSSMAFHPPTQRLILVVDRGTWAWDGTSWAELTPATPLPVGVTRGKLAWDPSRQRLVLHSTKGTFGWDGATWADLQPSQSPTSTPISLVFDSAANRLSMYSGSDEWVYLP